MRYVALFSVVVLLAAGCFSLEMRLKAAQLEYEKGLRFYERFELIGAKKAFTHALRLNPNHQGARACLEKVNRLLGTREGSE